MEISVIIPTYKPKEYFWECLNSLYNQTLDKEKFEVIVILNGCNEPWISQIINWIKLHPLLAINLYTTETPGVSNARNIGLKNASGKYITFIDDDDYISETYLADMVFSIEKDPGAVIISNSISFRDGSGVIDNYSLRKLFYKLKAQKSTITLFSSRSIFNGPWMKLLPKEIVDGILFDTSFSNSEDSLYMYEISKNISKIELSSENAIYYRRIRSNSAITTKKRTGYILKNQCRFFCKVISIYLRNPLKYNLPFTLSRLGASIKYMFLQLKKN